MTQQVNSTASGNNMQSDLPTALFGSERAGSAVAISEGSSSSGGERADNVATTSTIPIIRIEKMSRLYESVYTHMKRLESRLNEVARTMSDRFSEVDDDYRVLSSGQFKLFDLMSQPR